MYKFSKSGSKFGIGNEKVKQLQQRSVKYFCKASQLDKKKELPPGLMSQIYMNKGAIFFAGASLLYLGQGMFGMSFVFASVSFLCYFRKNTKMIHQTQNIIDETFAERTNNKILYAVEELKKYIFRHPQLFRLFPENASNLHALSFVGYLQNDLGRGIDHEEKLSTKRWTISAKIINESKGNEGFFESIVLFHTPTHFVIEYLRVEVFTPVHKIITIIDGRRDMKEWVHDMKQEKINTRIYPKYRDDDKVKY